jgi:hypothetical protein
LRIDFVKILCNADETVVQDRCTLPSGVGNFPYCQQLPLHLLIEYHPPMLEVSDEADCFRLFLRIYPASAGIKDGNSQSPYDLAILKSLSVYFIRSLLSADPTIDPVKRKFLNFGARKEGMFLAFRALSTNRKPTIWAKIRHEDKNLLAHVISYL